MEVVISIAGLIIAWLTFKKTFYAEPIEEKQNLLACFIATRGLSKELCELVTAYALERNALDVELFHGITYRNYIEALTELQRTGLSDELYQKIRNLKLTKSNIATLQKDLDAQREELQKIKNLFTMASL